MKQTKALDHIRQQAAGLFLNPLQRSVRTVLDGLRLSVADIHAAQARLQRFAPLLQMLFPELQPAAGLIESPLMAIPRMQDRLEKKATLGGRCWLKCDHALPVAGSVKARGGIYEVLCRTEALAIELGLLADTGDYTTLNRPAVRKQFARHTMAVGSTGNLGLSIGIMARALGFNAVVHMSADARTWKKQLLKMHGVTVIEHDSDYSAAVRAGRQMAADDPSIYFVDDENSAHLFLGYSVAGPRLKKQLKQAGITVDADHPLFVYLPCGVGGAPGGIAFGIKAVFGDAAHCFFAEPVQAPAVTLAMLHSFEHYPTVYEFGLSIDTEADGLAVGCASRLAGDMMRPLVSGCFTVTDNALFDHLYHLQQTENIAVEPSAAAGFNGPHLICNSPSGRAYLKRHALDGRLEQATHLIWSTGGGLLPPEVFAGYMAAGRI